MKTGRDNDPYGSGPVRLTLLPARRVSIDENGPMRPSPRRCIRWCMIVALGLFLLTGVLPAGMASVVAAEPGPSFTVESPTDVVNARAGAQARASFTVTNTGPSATFAIDVVSLDALDEGRLQPSTSPLSAVAGSVRVSQPFSLPSANKRQVDLEINVPFDTAPDLYLVGLLVRQNINPSGVVNDLRVLAHVTVNVLGPALRDVSVQHDGPRFAFGSIDARFAVRDTGNVGVVFKHSIEMGGGFIDDDARLLDTDAGRSEALATGTSKSIRYQWKPGTFTVGRFVPSMVVQYDDDGVTSYREGNGQAIFVLGPGAFVVVVALLLFAGAAIAVALHRRRRRRSTRWKIRASR